MTKVGISLVSNRSNYVKDTWLKGLGALDRLRNEYDVVFSFQFQEPFSSSVVKECEKLGIVVMNHKYPGNIFNWIPYREASLQAIECDFAIVTDDDYKFSDSVPSGYTSSGRYIDAISYLEGNPECGCVLVKPFFGGAAQGTRIDRCYHDICSNQVGNVFRILHEIDWKYCDPIFNIPGALEDLTPTYSRLEQGYWIAKMFNCPTSHGKTKHLEYGSPHPAYDEFFVNNEGIGNLIRNRYNDPNWTTHQKRIPQGMLSFYLKACEIKNHKPKYPSPRRMF